MNPKIDYSHVMKELSVNRNNPLEVVRELISNSYDAKADNIAIASMKSLSGLLYFDDGEGLGPTKKINGITPYEAFFSIGKSTKIQGGNDNTIGYKCQGSKLCFASNRLMIITKTQNEKGWRIFHIDNPRDNLDNQTDITPTNTQKPWQDLKSFLKNGGKDVVEILNSFGQEFFESEFSSGLLVSIVGYDDDDFEKNFCSDELDVKKSNLYNYIRFFTKIGDVRHITLEQGFSDRDVNSFGIDSGPTLNIYYNNEWWLVPFGYPYIQDSERTHKKTPEIKGPADVNSLDDGRFYARYAKRINEYYFVLAIDGNRRANDNYNYLRKKGDPLIKGKIRFTDQRGVLVSSSGVRVTDYTDIFDLQGIDEKFKKLNDSKSKRHYQLMIDGPFDLITNRTGLSEKATKDFRRNIIAKLNDFLQECYSNTKDHTFMHLIDRLGNDMRDHKLDSQFQKIKKCKDEIKFRERFKIFDRYFVSPVAGEEYLVGVLYALLGSHEKIPKNYLKYWKSILTYSSNSIDSIAYKNMDKATHNFNELCTVEYKYSFSTSDRFNHPLALVDYIVAWELDINLDCPVLDDYSCQGEITKIEEGIYQISDITSVNGGSERSRDDFILVINLRKLIEKSFSNVKFTKFNSGNKK